MGNRVLDIWAVQSNPDELYTALDNINEDVIIFKNCLSKFKIGKSVIKTMQFSTVVYSEKSDTMVILMRGGKATSEMAEQYLDKRGVDYNIVNFIDLPDYIQPTELKEFWFAREKYVLEDAINDSIKKGITSCKYDTKTKSKLIFKYTLTNGKDAIILSVSFKGVIEFEDKFILPTISVKQKNLHKDDILPILHAKNINVEAFDANCSLQI